MQPREYKLSRHPKQLHPATPPSIPTRLLHQAHDEVCVFIGREDKTPDLVFSPVNKVFWFPALPLPDM